MTVEYSLPSETEMPLKIEDKRTKEVKAYGVTGNTLRCGHCDLPIQDDLTWVAIDDPYFCLVHETCLGLFKFDGMRRTREGPGRIQAKRDLDDMQAELHKMISRPWWQNNKGAARYHKALQDMLLLHQSLRTARVIVDVEKPAVIVRSDLLAMQNSVPQLEDD